MVEVNREKFLNEIEHIGFTIHRNVFDKQIISELNEYAKTLNPERGHDKNQKWYGWNHVSKYENAKEEVDWGYYWTPYAEHPHIETVKKELAPLADAAFGNNNWGWHVQDFIILYPGMNFYRPHIDTPYRFKEFRYAEGLLGLQFMVMMCDFTPENGATGYVPGTHKYIFDGFNIKDHYDVWNPFFADNYQQYTAGAGSFVCWHPRLLHSTMPNKSNEIRRALLLHAAEKKTARRLEVIDPQVNSALRTT
jgi:ectoine hydroxylase-related dioxygenase (phytanoyl-CoA dioxygenase family)